jgi:hypothetical protein
VVPGLQALLILVNLLHLWEQRHWVTRGPGEAPWASQAHPTCDRRPEKADNSQG